MKNLIMMIAALSITAGLGGAAMAAPCKDVNIKISNRFEIAGQGIQIKVIDFDYWDHNSGKWREEAGVSNQIFASAEPGTFVHYVTRDLEWVRGELIAIRVQYKYLTATNGWSETLDAQTVLFTCQSNATIGVTVDPL